MPPKRNAAVDAEEVENVHTKMWKANPPGPEQKHLNQLFEKKLISRTDTPSKVQSRYPIFAHFSTKTFGLHFRTTKARYGLNACGDASSGSIPELDGTDVNEEDSRPTTGSPSSYIESQLQTRNYPYLVWTYTDHNSQKELVCVAVPTVTGSRDITFTVSDDGLQLIVDFVWPKALLAAESLFYDVKEDDDDEQPISMDHAKVYAFRNHLIECSLSAKSKPTSSFVINLPIKVQRELGTYTKQALKCGDAKIAMLTFTAYQKKSILLAADNSIKF